MPLELSNDNTKRARVMDLEGVCHQHEFGYWAGGKKR